MNISKVMNENGSCSTLFIVSAADLNNFANELISKTRQIVEDQYQDQFYTLADLTKLLRVSDSTIYNYINRGIISVTKLEGSGRTLFSRQEIREAINSGKLRKYVHK